MSALSGLHEEEFTGRAYDGRLLRRVLAFVRPHARIGSVGLLLIMFSTAAAVLLPGVQGLIISDLQSGGARLAHLAMIFAAIGGLKLLLDASQMYLLQVFGQRVIFDMRVAIFAHLQRVPIAYFHHHASGSLVTRVSNDVEAMNEFVTAGLMTTLRDLLLMASACVIMPIVSFKLGITALAVLPILIVAIVVFRARARRAYREVRRRLSRLNAYVAESIGGMSVIQTTAREKLHAASYDEQSRMLAERSIKSVHYWAIFSPFVAFLSGAALALVLHKGAKLVLDQEIDVGLLAAFLWWTKLYFQPVRDIAEKYNIFQSAMASAERIFRVLDEPVDPALAATGAIREVEGAIAFESVGFAYVPGRPALEEVSFTVEPGQRVALVGHTGSGKSTIIRLLMRLHDPTSGKILVDGRELTSLAPREWRRHLGVVHQDVFLFGGSILDNIRLFDESISPERVQAAARRVHADRFIESRPEGYLYEVKEQGVRLSSGERQLLSFARALVREPSILILDEATALVDTETESLIQDALAVLMRGRTSIVVAHRLSTIVDADMILVLDEGRIVERGRHDELLALGGRYRDLHRAEVRTDVDPVSQTESERSRA